MTEHLVPFHHTTSFKGDTGNPFRLVTIDLPELYRDCKHQFEVPSALAFVANPKLEGIPTHPGFSRVLHRKRSAFIPGWRISSLCWFKYRIL
jgi:hypothetical protein